jgi:hypothetical protein
MKEVFRIQVSAKHLMLASPMLKKTLSGGWKESVSLLNKGSVEITVHNWDLEALLLLLNIIHCRHNDLPRDISLELLAKFAVIVDYYGCSDAVRFFTDTWINSLKSKGFFNRVKYSRDTILGIWISWVFRVSEAFRTSTSDAMRYSEDQIKHLDLPIPTEIISKLEHIILCRKLLLLTVKT